MHLVHTDVIQDHQKNRHRVKILLYTLVLYFSKNKAVKVVNGVPADYWHVLEFVLQIVRFFEVEQVPRLRREVNKATQNGEVESITEILLCIVQDY